MWRTPSVNRKLRFYEEGIRQAKEALEIYRRLDDGSGQVHSLSRLAYLLHDNGQLNAAEEAASEVINRFSGEGEQFQVCQCYRILSNVYDSRHETEKAIDHFKIALEIASSFNWHDPLFWTHYSLAELRSNEGRFDDAHTHIEHAKSHTANDAYNLGRAAELQARFWYRKQRFEEAGSAASHAADAFERLEAMANTKRCRALFEMIKHRDD